MVCWSVTFYFFYDFFLPHYSCQSGLVTSNLAPAHPHATWFAVHPALCCWDCQFGTHFARMRTSLRKCRFLTRWTTFGVWFGITQSLPSSCWTKMDATETTPPSVRLYCHTLFAKRLRVISDEYLYAKIVSSRHTDCGEAGSAASRKNGDRVGRSCNMAFEKMKKMKFCFERTLEQLSQINF